MDLADLLTKIKGHLPPEKLKLVEEAYHFAARCHDGQLRASGEPYFEHPLHAALFLANLQLDATSIAAALLHDVTEDCGIPLTELEERFGPEVSKLVDGTTKLSKLEERTTKFEPRDNGAREEAKEQARNIRKMLVAMAEDIRVVLIKMADRLHNMNTLKALPPDKRIQIARETLDIYAPLAHRLGMSQLEWQLEDLAFRYLQPEKYREFAHLVATNRKSREKYIAQVSRILKEELKKTGITADVTGRPKHIYSIYEKAQRYASQGKDFQQIYDLFALRVLVDEVKDCYSALGVIHALWPPVPGQFDDYIANSRETLYQSLHTTVMCLGGTPLEIQIRTHEMHYAAEYGVAAHWRYKEGIKEDPRFEERITWLRQLLEWQKEMVEAEDFLESVKTDIFQDQVFVYTPKGEVKEMPSGSTPIDFAYRIHTDIGHRCIGAKVNGKLISLDYQLRNGDTVKIVASKTDRGPSLDWLNPHLSYVQTAHAREKIKQWFRKQERPENIQRGRELLEKEFKRLSISVQEEELAHLFKYDSVDEFLTSLGSGGITIHQIANKLTVQEDPQATLQAPPTQKLSPAGVEVLGVGNLLTHLAQCCNPLPGDDIVGFITRTQGITIHKSACTNILHQKERERIVQVNWGSTKQGYPVRVCIQAWDRVGLLRDITTVVSAEKVNIGGITSINHEDGTVSEYLTLHTTGIEQLSRLLSKLERVRNVSSVTRTTLTAPSQKPG